MRRGLCWSAAALLLGSSAFADEASTIAEAITSGEAGVNLRARYESVDQDGFDRDASALTARLRLNYKTGEWQGLRAFVEYDYVGHLINDFNSGAGTSPDKGDYPVVADPKGSDLNQLYLDWKPSSESRLRLGRQRILLDDQRFVGGVGWRQNEQTYDAITYQTMAIAKTDFSYSYISDVRRIFGEGVAAGHNNVDTHLLNAKVTVNDAWSVTPYYYRIDNDDVAAFSTATLGARLKGSLQLESNQLELLAEFATQSDIANNPVNYDAQYIHLSGLWALDNGLTLGLAFESLGGDNDPGKAFRTPLATLHAFQGWADQFLATPTGGVEDLFATVKYKSGPWSFTGVYHDFSAETGSTDYGTELDLSAGRKFADNYSILFKGAFFAGDAAPFPDTNKFWIMFTANY